MIEKLNLEFPTQVVNCQEKKAALQQQWHGQQFSFQLRGSVWEDTFLPRGWDGEKMPIPDSQNHPVFIPMTSRVKIWDFRLRI